MGVHGSHALREGWGDLIAKRLEYENSCEKNPSSGIPDFHVPLPWLGQEGCGNCSHPDLYQQDRDRVETTSVSFTIHKVS